MITKNFAPDIYSQQYLELLLQQRFPSYLINDIVPFTFVYTPTNGGFAYNANVLYYGELFNQNGASAVLLGSSFPLPVLSSPLTCLFDNIADLTDTYVFHGWKVQYDNPVSSVIQSAPTIVIPPPNVVGDVRVFYKMLNTDGTQLGDFCIQLSTAVDNTKYRLGVFFDGSTVPLYTCSVAELNAGKSWTNVNPFGVFKLAFLQIGNLTNYSTTFFMRQANYQDVLPYNLYYRFADFSDTSDLGRAGFISFSNLNSDVVDIISVSYIEHLVPKTAGPYYGLLQTFSSEISCVYKPFSAVVVVRVNGFTCPFTITEKL